MPRLPLLCVFGADEPPPRTTHATPALVDEASLADALDAIGRHATPKERRQEVIAALRACRATALADAQARLLNGATGLVVSRMLSDLMDSIVRALRSYLIAHEQEPSNPREASYLTIVAVGGYGRGLLAPGSDIDLLFLIPPWRPDWSIRLVETMLYYLWDLGLKVGHATRTVSESLRLARGDHTIATTLLETRFIVGDEALVDELNARFWTEVASAPAIEFVEAKLKERDERHARAGGSRYRVEPNIKDSKGGLRDLHTLYWIAKYVYHAEDSSDLVDAGVLTPQEYNTFRRAEAFLWDVRCHLHFLAGRAEENLTFDYQVEMARRMGYRDRGTNLAVEQFMRTYFLVAKDVGDLTRIICANLEVTQRKAWPSLGRLLPMAGPRIAAEGFLVDSGRLTVAGPEVFEADPVNLLRLFHTADEKRLHIHPQALHWVARSLERIDDALRADKTANRLFLEMLTSRHDPERCLRTMNEAGVLGRFIPEFGRIVAQMQFNMYHHYTVDEHIIRVVGQVAAIERGDREEDMAFFSRVAANVRSRSALFLAALLHDIAKGVPGDHSEAGAQIASRLGPRLGLSPAEVELTQWLVLHHLRMSFVAQQRDVSDPQTVRDFADFVQSPERLRLLLVLTAADIRGVGPFVWNAWKGQLLKELFIATEHALKGEEPSHARLERAAEQRAAVAESLHGWSPEARMALMHRLDDAYWLAFDEETLKAHARLLKKADEARAAGELALALRLEAAPERAVSLLDIVTEDRAGLFVLLTGAIAAAGASVLDAKVFTTTDRLALDTFALQDTLDAPFIEPTQVARLEALIARALKTGVPPEPSRERAVGRRREEAFTVAPAVYVDNGASESFTVVEVNGRDRPGLLFDLARAFAGLKVSISSAQIATYGERAVDVFYVKDAYGLKVEKPSAVELLEQRLLAALRGED
ncbi:MAG: [protein-PII] uridylyltransferase [Alphaproteobacteria bacterium]|nr:[protein-PII] uridylyltransferase [Alphaproteobacteria bacterium]